MSNYRKWDVLIGIIQSNGHIVDHYYLVDHTGRARHYIKRIDNHYFTTKNSHQVEAHHMAQDLLVEIGTLGEK